MVNRSVRLSVNCQSSICVTYYSDQHPLDLVPRRHPEGLGHILAREIHPHRVCQQGEELTWQRSCLLNPA